MAMNEDLKTHSTTDTGHGRMHLVPPIAVAVVLGFAILLAVVVLLWQSVLGRPGLEPTPPLLPAPPSLGGGTLLVPLLLGALLLVLIGVFILLLVLIICMCGCKCGGASGLPLPSLRDLSRIAAILRGIATALREGANRIDTANAVVNGAREKLLGVTDFKIRNVPKFKFVAGIPVFDDGYEDISLFDDEAERALRAFANDATGKTILDGASAMLRDKAVVLDEQANALGSQS